MALIVTQERPNIYTVELSYPDLEWLHEVAAALGMTKSAVLAASVNQGLTHYHTMCIELGNQESKNSDKSKDVGKRETFNKGSCRG